MAKRQNLNRLVAFIGDLLDQEEHDWLIDKLLRVIEQKAPVEEIAKHAVIKNIHEYCVEGIVEEQAKKFYKNFRIEELKPQLIQDFIKMEHERRRDDFENFCLHMYQQVEGIVNYLFFNESLLESLISKRGQSAFVKGDKSRHSDGYRLDLMIFRKEFGFNVKEIDNWFKEKKFPKWSAANKFRVVLYFYYFLEIVYSIEHFNTVFDVFSELYGIRNRNHRGGVIDEDRVIEYFKINSDKSKYYFKFYGFLADFVTTINNHLPEPKESLEILEGFTTKSLEKAMPREGFTIPVSKEGPDGIVK